MSLLSRLALLFVGIPLLELFILIQLGQIVGLWPTIGLVVFTGFAGAALARLEGLRTLWSIRGELARGRLPGNALLDGLAILVGGALLLTPGILTDLLGFSFLFPPTRRFLMGRIRKNLEGKLRSGAVQLTFFSGLPGSFGSGLGPEAWDQDGSDHGPVSEPPRPRPGEIIVEPKDREGE
jgi:UPF0716 protein FxsA